MSLRYHSGEDIQKGDQVLLSGESGVIEIVADPSVSDSETQWYIGEFAGGVMVSQIKRLGSVFVPDPESEEDLKFVSRAGVNNRKNST